MGVTSQVLLTTSSPSSQGMLGIISSLYIQKPRCLELEGSAPKAEGSFPLPTAESGVPAGAALFSPPPRLTSWAAPCVSPEQARPGSWSRDLRLSSGLVGQGGAGRASPSPCMKRDGALLTEEGGL